MAAVPVSGAFADVITAAVAADAAGSDTIVLSTAAACLVNVKTSNRP